MSAFGADVNLEWRVTVPIVRVFDTVEVGLYAVSDDGGEQAIAGVDAVIGWDADVLALAGKIDSGVWLGSWFPDDSGLDGLNADCADQQFCDPYTGMPFNDGDALFAATASSNAPVATAGGLLVITLVFNATAATSTTQVNLLANAGDFSSTKVVAAPYYDVVTGVLGTLSLSIASCGSQGDFDGDCTVSTLDYSWFAPCLTGPGGVGGEPECQASDLDLDGDADLRDFALLQMVFTSP